MAVNKKIIVIVLAVVLVASVIFWGVYYGTTIIPRLSTPQNTIALRFVGTSMEPTIMAGNFILVNKNIDPSNLNADYPQSDIIVFTSPYDPNAGYIASRIVNKETINGTVYYQTKGDNKLPLYPQVPTAADLDNWGPSALNGIPQNLIIGKVVNTNYR